MIACLILLETFSPSTTSAAWRKSSIRELVHDPMNILSRSIDFISVLGSRPIYASVSTYSSSLSIESELGIHSSTDVTISGEVPHVTWG